MTSKVNMWMPLFIGDYLADTQCLTRDEHGGYLLLLMAYWRAGVALPDDDKHLGSIVKASPAEWRRLRPVLAEFFTIDGGKWSHKRVEAELAAADAYAMKRRGKATDAARARWKDHAKDAQSNAPGNAPGNAPSNAQSNAPAMLEPCHARTVSPSPSPTPEPKDRAAPLPAASLLPDVDPQVVADWLKVCREKKKAVTETAIKRLRLEAAKAGLSMQAVLTLCCENGWAKFEASWPRDGSGQGNNGSRPLSQNDGREAANRTMMFPKSEQ